MVGDNMKVLLFVSYLVFVFCFWFIPHVLYGHGGVCDIKLLFRNEMRDKEKNSDVEVTADDDELSNPIDYHQKGKLSLVGTCGEKAKRKGPMTTSNMGINYTLERDKSKEIEATDGTRPNLLTLSLEDMKSKISMGDMKSKKDVREWTNIVPQDPITFDTSTPFPTFNQKEIKTSSFFQTVGDTPRDLPSPPTKNNNHLLHAHATSHHPLPLSNPTPPIHEFSQVTQNRKRINIRNRLKNSIRKKPKAEGIKFAETEDVIDPSPTTSETTIQMLAEPEAGPAMQACLEQ
ncbi:hypothetical protein L6452_00752 [Arctium lappa]|uniref:Uncharacterized protein n=1 Tax=Arctium lappa TaxID=4217 RepID=A0ACB9FE80_ARCLA|nr:hypothetical protein L6452_00752 [Arctium lappa]